MPCRSAGANAQEPAVKGSRPRPRNLAVAGKAGSSSRGPTSSDGSRAAAAGSPQGTADGNSGSTSGPGSCSSSNSSSRRGSGDKPHVPIWERSLPSGPAEARRTAAAAAAGPKVLQTVALKTFSPTLGNFGLMLTEQGEAALLWDSLQGLHQLCALQVVMGLCVTCGTVLM